MRLSDTDLHDLARLNRFQGAENLGNEASQLIDPILESLQSDDGKWSGGR